MKFGFRTPSLKKRIAARTSPARFVRHSLGLKSPRGWGWLTNPKKAVYNRVYNRTTFGCLLPSLAGLFLVALMAGLAFAQSASVYSPSGGYMGRIVVNPQSFSPGAMPAATPEGISVGAQECPKEKPSDWLKGYLPVGMEMAPGQGGCDGRVTPNN